MKQKTRMVDGTLLTQQAARGGGWWKLPDGAQLIRNEGGPGWRLIWPDDSPEELVASLGRGVRLWRAAAVLG